MKKYIILIAIASLLSTACKQNTNSPEPQTVASDTLVADHPSTSAITFDNPAHDFGKIAKDTKPEHYFRYQNTGTEPLVLINVSAGCGCTVIEFPKTPLASQGMDSIHVQFTGAKEGGDFMKTITVQSNASNGTQSLQIKGKQL